MASNITIGTISGPSTPSSKRQSAFDKRIESLRSKAVDSDIGFEDLTKSNFRSSVALNEFSRSIKKLDHLFVKLEKDLSRTSSPIFGAGAVPTGFRSFLDRYKKVATTITELTKAEATIEKSASKMRSGSPGTKVFAKALNELSFALSRGETALPKHHGGLAYEIARSFRTTLRDARGTLAGGYVSNIAQGVGYAGAMGVALASKRAGYVSNIAKGVGYAGAMGVALASKRAGTFAQGVGAAGAAGHKQTSNIIGRWMAGAAGVLGAAYEVGRVGGMAYDQYKGGRIIAQQAFEASRFGAGPGADFGDVAPLFFGNKGAIKGLRPMTGPESILSGSLESAGLGPEDRMAIARKYGYGSNRGLFSAMHSVAAAKVSPELGFIDSEEYAGHLGRLRGAYKYGSGNEAQRKSLASAIEGAYINGAQKSQVWKNMQDSLEVIARNSGGAMPDYGRLTSRIAAMSASTIPSLPTGEGISSGYASIMSANANIVQQPYLYTLMAQMFTGADGTVNTGTIAGSLDKWRGKGAGKAWLKGLNPHATSELNRRDIANYNKLSSVFENTWMNPDDAFISTRNYLRSLGIPDLIGVRIAASSGIYGDRTRAMALHAFGFGGTGDTLGTRIAPGLDISALSAHGGRGLPALGGLVGTGIKGAEGTLETFEKNNALINTLNQQMVKASEASTALKMAITGAFGEDIKDATSAIRELTNHLGPIMEGIEQGLFGLRGRDTPSDSSGPHSESTSRRVRSRPPSRPILA
jgi:hypothetical protein